MAAFVTTCEDACIHYRNILQLITYSLSPVIPPLSKAVMLGRFLNIDLRYIASIQHRATCDQYIVPYRSESRKKRRSTLLRLP